MSEEPPAVDAYFARIGYGGPQAPTLAALRAIVLAHATAIPFENLDVLLGRGARLDGPALADKLVERRRGGYCFEHNLLLLSILRRLGFRAEGLAARVTWGRPPGSAGPRTHMLVEVALPEGPHLADVGFGGLTPTAPLALETGSAQATPHETFRLAAEDGFALEAQRGEDWQSLYRFTREPQAPIDYEVANWYTATHPQSLFTNHLIAARPGPGCRYTLFDDKFAIRRLDGTSERRRIRDAADLGEALAEAFGIAVAPDDLAALAA
ncbi:MAG TPA: arylamine N-acetyltransferase, partial [Stellaceae bacterium]|nr:arylamine N-acetyltransferase [Stellaceae bacterium]